MHGVPLTLPGGLLGPLSRSLRSLFWRSSVASLTSSILRFRPDVVEEEGSRGPSVETELEGPLVASMGTAPVGSALASFMVTRPGIGTPPLGKANPRPAQIPLMKRGMP